METIVNPSRQVAAREISSALLGHGPAPQKPYKITCSKTEDCMKRFVVTGAPGSGKTAIIRQLELDGFSVVEEAATDVISLQQARGIDEPWKYPWFVDAVADLQRLRQLRDSYEPERTQFHDRSVICTAALAAYLGYPVSDTLSHELERITTDAIFEKRVFFLRNLGLITPTEARRISFEETLCFERIHEETYRNFGFEIVFIEAGNLLDRVAAIKAEVATVTQQPQPLIR
jgi:predicted ATPase